MTTWNYRVIKTPVADTGEWHYQIHEVYYDERGRIECWTQQPVEPLGVAETALRNDISAFLHAFSQPTLEERYYNGRAVLVEEKPPARSRDLEEDYRHKVNRATGYLSQMLGNHLLLKKDPALRQAYNKLDSALAELYELTAGGASHATTEPAAQKIA